MSPAVESAANSVANRLNADVLLINAAFEPADLDWKLAELVEKRLRRQEVLVLLVSNGGDASTAYRVARTLQRAYSCVRVFVPGWCKSAGTLCAIGAHELIIGDRGELGPIDVQVTLKDELGERNSGLTVSDSLARLQLHAFEMFQRFMLEIKERSYGAVSFRLAAEISAKMTVGLLEPIYRQVDPVQIGNLGRAMSIAKDYALRLTATARNATESGITALIESYPSHDFVIDRREAKELFNAVREPAEDEKALARSLGDISLLPANQQIVKYISAEKASDHDLENTSESVLVEAASDGDIGRDGDARDIGDPDASASVHSGSVEA